MPTELRKRIPETKNFRTLAEPARPTLRTYPNHHSLEDDEYGDSDEDEEEDEGEDEYDAEREESLYKSIETIHTQDVNISYSRTVIVPQKQSKASKLVPLFSIVVLLLFVLVWVIGIDTSPEQRIDNVNRQHLVRTRQILDESIDVIRKRFPSQKPQIWVDVASGIYDVVLYPSKPAVMILFGNETAPLNCLARAIAELSTLILGSRDYLLLKPRDFPNDIGNTISSLKETITAKKSVVIEDLAKVNSNAIRAFHNFCDRERPLVRRVVYVMTVVTDLAYRKDETDLAFLERKLYETFAGKIDKDILDPLLTRLTDGVVASVLPEPGNRDSCL